MSRYDGLIIPRSYSEYINKTDAATLSQALQLAGVLAQQVTAGNNAAVTSSAVNAALSEYINKTDAATLSQALQLSGVLSEVVAADDNKAVTSSAVNAALTNYINKTDAATLQQALQLPGVLSGAVAAGDNKAVTSNAVNNALENYNYVNVHTTSTGAFSNKFEGYGIHEIIITDILDANKWIKLIYSTDGVHYEIVNVINRTLNVKDANALGTIVIEGGSGKYKSFSIFHKL